MKQPNTAGQAAVPEGRMAEYVNKKKRRTLLRLLKNFGYHKTLSLLALLFAGATSLVTIIKPYLLKL